MANNKPKASRDIAIYTAGTILRQLVGFIMLPIYTSYLSPADYGIVSLLTISISIFELVLGARFAQAIPRFYYDSDDALVRNRVLSTALTVTALFSSIGVAIIWAMQTPLSSVLFGTTEYTNYIAIYGILLFGTGIEYYGMTYLRLLEKPIAFVTVSILKLIVQLALNIYLVVILDYGVMGVVISGVVSTSLFAAVFMWVIYSRCGFKVDLSLAKRLFIYCWPLWAAGGASLYMQSSNRFFIRFYSSMDEVGLFELATKFSMILGLLVWQPFGNWWQTERFRLLKESDDPLRFQRVFNFVTVFMLVGVLGISLFTGPVIQLMSDPAFHSAANAIIPLTFAGFMMSFGMFFNFPFLATDNTIYITYLKYASAILVTVAYVLFIPVFGFVGAGYAILFTNTLLFIVTFYCARKKLDLNINLLFFSCLLGLALVGCYVDVYLSSILSFWIGVTFKTILVLTFCLFCLFMLSKNKATGEITTNFLRSPKFNLGKSK